MSRPIYAHTQAGWPLRIVSLLGAVMLSVAALVPGLSPTPRGSLLLLAAAALCAVAGWMGSSLTVRIQDGALRILFGPGLPRRTVPLAEIAAVEVTRTTFLEGWGLHRTRRGWLYNVSGFDAVLLRLTDGRSMMVGTDEPRRLKAAIERAQARA